MKNYKVITLSNMWSTDKLKREVQQLLNKKSQDGYEIVSVGFGINIWWIPTAFITICKDNK